MEDTMKKEWFVVGYDYQRNCDILDYYENGILQFSFYGYRNDRALAWRVYPKARGTYCYKKPNVSVVYYHEARQALLS